MQKYQKLFILTIAVLGAWFLFGHAKAAEAVSWTVKTGTTAETNAYMPYANTCTAYAPTSPNSRITLNLNFTDLPTSSGGYWVDFKRTYDYNTTQDDWIWNYHLAGGVQTFVTDGSNLIDSAWDAGGVNQTPKELHGGWNYYVRVYNPDTGVHTLFPGTLGTMVCWPGNAVPSQPTLSALPSCSGSAGYTTGTISWTGMYDNRAGFWVDISDVSDFSRWWYKYVGNTFSTNLSGFTGYQGVSGPMPALTAGATYYTRVYNGAHSTVRSFSVAECARPACTAGTVGPIGTTLSDTASTHTIYLTTTNATAVNIAIYNQATGASGTPLWWAATAGSGGSYTLTFDPRLYNSYGTFVVDIYMNNASWTDQPCGTHPNYTRLAPQPPSCSLGVNSATPDSFTTYDNSGTHTITLSGVSANTSYVGIAIWSDSGGQDDLIWYMSNSGTTRPTNQGGGVWTLVFDYGAHLGLGNVSVHAYVHNAVQNNVFCDSANFTRQLRPATTKPVASGLPTTTISGLGVSNTVAPCTTAASYTVTLSWTGMAKTSTSPIASGYWVDGSTSSTFATWWNKNIALPSPNTTSTNASTTAGTGFVPYSGVSGALTLQPGTSYYFRVYNDQHSPTSDPVFVARCGSLRVEPNNEAGAWTITNTSLTPNWSTSGTGTKQFNNNIPAGTYSLTPTANTPAGYNGTVTPATLVVP